MIYKSVIESTVNSEFDELLEQAEDRFKFETMAEAGAIILAEQEENWTKFMKGVGISELNTVMEGQEVVYEGGRLQSFVDKAKAYFKMALNKLAEITKSFIAKVMQLISTNNSFLKKYKDQLKDAGTIDFKGYKFSSKLDAAQKYNLKDWKEGIDAEENFDIKSGDGTFGDRVKEDLYGGDKVETGFDVAKQVKILEDTKNIRKNAKDNYNKASKEVKKLIKATENAAKDVNNANIENKVKLSAGASESQMFQSALTYYKNYSSLLLTYHHKYLAALGARNRQAKAICTKALTKSYKKEGRNARNKLRSGAGIAEKQYSESTDAFLGAIDFI